MSVLQVYGLPLTEEMRLMFMPWGVASGIMLVDNPSRLRVFFEGGDMIEFAPVSVGAQKVAHVQRSDEIGSAESS